MTDRKAGLVIGAGDATGAAIAKRFAGGGFHACVVRRPRRLDRLEALADEIRGSGGTADAYGFDAREEDQVVALIERIEDTVGPIVVAVFNIGANVRFPITARRCGRSSKSARRISAGRGPDRWGGAVCTLPD